MVFSGHSNVTSIVTSMGLRKNLARAALMIVVVLGGVSRGAAGDDPAQLLFGMEAAYARVESYTARFVRQEVVEGTLRPREEALLTFQRPRLIYLRWVAGPPAGRQILFVPGRNDDRMLVREPGFFTGLATIVMAPDSARVLRESRHPVTDIGIGHLIERILDTARGAQAAGNLTVRDGGTVAGADGRERRLELVLSRDWEDDCHRMALSVSGDAGLPVRATIYDWDDRMVADYAYRELRLNPPLTRADFDAANPEYGFPSWRVAR
jgi:outer membrane lipoprotein-sorting protein